MSTPHKFTRREMLRLGVAGGAAVAAGALWPVRVVSAAAKDAGKGFRFIHYTDIHVQPELDGARGYAQAIAHMNSQKAAFALSGGDLVFDSLSQTRDRVERLWKMYTSLSKEFAVPHYQVMGNHDNWGLSSKSISPSEPGYGKRMFLDMLGQERTYRSYDHGGWHFVLLDSIFPKEGGGWEPRLDEAQMAWLKSELAAHKNQPQIVALHVPVVTFIGFLLDGPLAAPKSGRVMNDAKELRELFEANNVKLVLQGHNHIREHFEYNGTHYITGGAVCGAWWRGPNMGHPEGYATIDVHGDTFEWNYHTYGWKAKKQEAYNDADRRIVERMHAEREVFALI